MSSVKQLNSPFVIWVTPSEQSVQDGTVLAVAALGGAGGQQSLLSWLDLIYS